MAAAGARGSTYQAPLVTPLSLMLALVGGVLVNLARQQALELQLLRLQPPTERWQLDKLGNELCNNKLIRKYWAPLKKITSSRCAPSKKREREAALGLQLCEIPWVQSPAPMRPSSRTRRRGRGCRAAS